MKKIFIILFFALSTSLYAANVNRDFFGFSLLDTYNQLDHDYQTIDLPRDEIDAIYNYSIESYKEINPAFRKIDRNLLNNHKKAICNLDLAISKYKIRNLTLYRGSTYLAPGANLKGFIFNERAFSSTSIDRNVALNFATNGNTPILDIIDTSNTPVNGMWLNLVSDFREEEILLARDTSFIVDRVKKEFHFGREVTVRYLSVIEQNVSLEVSSVFNCAK